MRRWLEMGVLLLLFAAATGLGACGTAGSNAVPPETAGTAPETTNPALPPPPPPSRKGVVVPSDTGMGVGPAGPPASTGTNGTGVGPTLGGTNSGAGNSN